MPIFTYASTLMLAFSPSTRVCLGLLYPSLCAYSIVYATVFRCLQQQKPALCYLPENPRGKPMERRLAYIILNLLPGIGSWKVQQLVTYFGSAEAIFAASESTLQRVPGIGAKLAAILSRWSEHCEPENEKRLAHSAGVYLVTQVDECYPPLLREIHDPPLCLYVRGDFAALSKSRNSIAIVGSRQTTIYGRQMAAFLANGAVYHGWPVISGLARGIDTAAHTAAVQAGGCTIAVIGSGFCHLYPQENIPLAEKICTSGGAVISEFPMNYTPDKRSFPMRNRIIAGMSKGTIVVEAGLRSGSLITAAQAMEQNRTVFAVPGRVDTPFAKGCHALLRDGARLIESFQDVIEEFSLLPNLQINDVEARTRVRETQPIALQPLEKKIWDCLAEGEMAIDDLISRLEEPPSSILGCVLILEMKQVIRQLPGKFVARVANKMVN